MKKQRKILALFLSVLLVVGSMVGCSKESKETTSEKSGTGYKEEVIVAIVGNPTALDPHKTTSNKTRRIGVQIYEPLLNFDVDKKQVVPRLAKSWEMPSDHEYIFKLRDDVTFHNGAKMTAKDVKYSYERCLTMPAARPFVDAIKGMEIIDEYTIKITLKQPSPVFLGNICHGVTAIIQEGSGDKVPDEPNGTGPYKFVEWAVDDYVLLERFDGFWGGQKATKTIRIRIIPDNNARNLALEAKDIDLGIAISNADYSSIESNKDLIVAKEPTVLVEYLAMNVSKPPFNDVHVRKAVAYALNKDAIVKGIYQGDVISVKSMINPLVFGYDPDVKSYEYNVEKAREELAKSKYPNGFEFDCYTTKSRGRYTEAVQYDLSVIGIKMNVEFVQNVQSTISGGYEGAHITSIQYPTFDPDQIYRYMHSSTHGPGGNLTWFANQKMDKLLEKSRVEMEAEKRAAIIKEVQEILYQDVPAVPILSRLTISGYVKELGGFRPHPTTVDRIFDIYVKE